MSLTQHSTVAYRGSILHCLDDPASTSANAAVDYLSDGLLLVENGLIANIGDASQLLPTLGSHIPVIDHTGKLIVPGFVDNHIHFPQTDVIASHGKQLLEWLEGYVFPEEMKFADSAHAEDVARFFINELLRNGTTSALVLGTVHPQSVDALFHAAQSKSMRLIAGKVLMDRHCPPQLQDTPETAYSDSRALIEKWHGQDRLRYAITPRFAPTSTEEQLHKAAQLAAEFPDTYIHSHVAENTDEVAWVATLFPKARSYVDVYRQFGLMRERTILAHCIHLDDEDRNLFRDSGAAMAFCPTANLFLGSGLFDIDAAQAAGIKVGLGTDVGAGTSFSLLRTAGEAYKVAQLSQQVLTPQRAFYLATLGSATALHIDDKVGNLAIGKEADFLIIDQASTPLLHRRSLNAGNWVDRLFVLLTLGDDRAVQETFVGGRSVYQRGNPC